jgi:pSer/pThr/pTyr-binding forkhead associated (FHA) protein
MIKQFSIGRGDDCQIKIQDNSQKVSRNHATLKVLTNGKIFITDHSTNGTFVNGVKISQSVDYPVRRGDDISFAHVANLNWELIPRTVNKLIYYLAGAIIVVGIGISLYFLINKKCPIKEDVKTPVKVESIDSVKQKHTKDIDSTHVAQKEKEKKKTHKANSTETQKGKADNKSKTDTKTAKQKVAKPSTHAKNDSIKIIYNQ